MPYIYQILGKTIPLFLSLVISVIFIKYINVSSFAILNIIIFYFSIIFTLLSGGIDTLFHKIHNYQNLPNVIIFKLLAWLITSFIVITIMLNFYQTTPSIIVIILAALGTERIVNSLLVFFRIIEKDKFVLFPKVIQLISLLLLILIFKINSLIYYSIAFLISWLLSALFSGIISNKFMSLYKLFNPKKFFSKKNIKSCLYLSLSSSACLIYTNIDFIILEKLEGSLIAGSYKVSIMFAQSIILVYGATSHVFLSKISLLNNKIPSHYKRNLNSKMKNQFLLTTLISICFLIFATITFSFIFKVFYKNISPQFSQIAIFLILASAFNGYKMILEILLIHKEKEKIIFKINLIAIPASFLISLYFISTFKIIGAAYANITTYGCVLLVYSTVFYRLFFSSQAKSASGKTI